MEILTNTNTVIAMFKGRNIKIKEGSKEIKLNYVDIIKIKEGVIIVGQNKGSDIEEIKINLEEGVGFRIIEKGTTYLKFFNPMTNSILDIALQELDAVQYTRNNFSPEELINKNIFLDNRKDHIFNLLVLNSKEDLIKIGVENLNIKELQECAECFKSEDIEIYKTILNIIDFIEDKQENILNVDFINSFSYYPQNYKKYAFSLQDLTEKYTTYINGLTTQHYINKKEILELDLVEQYLNNVEINYITDDPYIEKIKEVEITINGDKFLLKCI